MKRVKSLIDDLVESTENEDVILKNLREMGFTVTPNEATDEDGTYTVEKDGHLAILDMSSDDDLHDSLRSIQAAFDLGLDLDDRGFPTMSLKTTDHSLAQRVASIGESESHRLHIKAICTYGGKKYEHDVYVEKPSWSPKPLIRIDETPVWWRLSDFMASHGPVVIDHRQRWTLVNADEIRDFLRRRSELSTSNFGWRIESEKRGLWYNIRKKKERMGKNYRPAKPGEKGRPTPSAWKNASTS